MLVVAGALKRDDGRWLMHKRPEGKHHAGLWEFPGGKVEDTEFPPKALCRELLEELGVVIAPENCTPVAFAQTPPDSSQKGIVILLYNIEQWAGDPVALEGGAIDWFTEEEIATLAKPPLDKQLCSFLFKKDQPSLDMHQ